MLDQLILSPDRFRAHATERLLKAPTDTLFDPRSGRAMGRSDWDLDPELAGDLAVMEAPTPAAVLVPIVMRETLTVLLTQRTDTLNKHAGQISFPGGRVDPEDTGPIDTACREAEEEIGLHRHHVEHLGYLDGYRTGTGYHITPVVALVRPPFELTLQADEVAHVFEVPLAFLMNPANHHQHSREWRGRQRSFWAMPYNDHYIWGATAGMLKNLAGRLGASASSSAGLARP
jgi:8-oxo-dGTP pyrophosphatase MutT (NUDIX family)